MTKLLYLATMALLGLGLTMAQSSSPASDSSNSSKAAQSQSSPDSNGAPGKSSRTDHTSTSPNKRRSQQPVLDTTVQDQQNSTTSTTGASGQENQRPSTSRMGTTGSTPETDNTAPAGNPATTPQNGMPPDQQPNSSSSPSTPTPHLVMNATPGARAVATHTPDPGTCMNPASLQNGQDATSAQRPSPNCD